MSITVQPTHPDFNRCTMHRARPFDTTKVRDFRRVTTRHVASTLEQAA